MSEEADENPGLIVTEDEQMNEEKRESEQSSLLENQATVMMTGNKVTRVVTPSKEEGKKELSWSELGSSPIGSFQSLQSSQSSEEDKMIPCVPWLGEVRILQFEDTLSEEDHKNFDLIYESLLLEERAGNLTDLTLGMVLAEKPPTWLQVMQERLEHLIISSEKFKEKTKAEHEAQARGKQVSREKGKILYRKDDKPKMTSGDKQRSGPTIGIHDKLICLFDFSVCVDFWVLF